MNKITEKQVDDITSMLCSDIKTEKKALELYAFFEKYNILKSNESYKDLDPIILKRFNKIINIYDYFKKNRTFSTVLDSYNSTIIDLFKKFKRLNSAWEIMNSSKDELDKFEEMKNLYKSSEALKTEFMYILKTGFEDSIYDMAREALDNFDSILKKYESYETGDFAKNLELMRSNKKYQKNYEFAKDVVTYYIESPDSYTDSIFFFSRLNINKHTFERCLHIVERTNPELYKKYLAKTMKDDKIRDEKYTEIIKDLANGIRTGQLSDGSKFDKIEFIKRIPFKTGLRGGFTSKLIDFLDKHNPDDKELILQYVYDNSMNADFYFRRLYISYFYNIKTKVGNIEITNEDNDLIFDYLYLNNIPCIFATYKLVRQKLVDGEITAETINELKAKQDPLVKKVLTMDLN